MNRNLVVVLLVLVAAAVVSFLYLRPERVSEELALHTPAGERVALDDLFGDKGKVLLVVLFRTKLESEKRLQQAVGMLAEQHRLHSGSVAFVNLALKTDLRGVNWEATQKEIQQAAYPFPTCVLSWGEDAMVERSHGNITTRTRGEGLQAYEAFYHIASGGKRCIQDAAAVMLDRDRRVLFRLDGEAFMELPERLAGM
ncbi:MAG: hypothetical protein JXR96_13545 [Deltaproteobacteria bacterium]|nr:hypothetical protein [Deltaproteobacteria bacterium]